MSVNTVLGNPDHASKAPFLKKLLWMNSILTLPDGKIFTPHRPLIRNRLLTTQLPISFGLASNEMMAKSPPMKQSQMVICRYRLEEKEFLAPLPVNKIPGVGDHTYEVLDQWASIPSRCQ
jgi:DNA polymerase-4